MSDNRDWQADMNMLRKIPHSFVDLENIVYNIAPYWMHEAEKWRVEAFKQHPTQDAYDAACAALHKHRERADQAEAREQKLKEAIKKSLTLYHYDGFSDEEAVEAIRDELEGVMASLYPVMDKEAEA
ncbi:hypothetical protein MAM1_0664c11094 [Mucor ambiguus]|uniref:Uncharacterized protein n=1 Tax=Mucor ambiguus TaxID=91626 RepID=A0A0C9LZ02_9FUNG|nr:hypothetical protein MAM1_0664c11094 [Mucor ambiguus]